jgi:hypothetical protein
MFHYFNSSKSSNLGNSIISETINPTGALGFPTGLSTGPIGGGGEGGGSGATTTQGGGGQGGGGAGDSGNLYKPSNLASIFKRALGSFFTSSVSGNAQPAVAQVAVPVASQSSCSLKVFGVCVVSNVMGGR